MCCGSCILVSKLPFAELPNNLLTDRCDHTIFPPKTNCSSVVSRINDNSSLTFYIIYLPCTDSLVPPDLDNSSCLILFCIVMPLVGFTSYPEPCSLISAHWNYHQFLAWGSHFFHEYLLLEKGVMWHGGNGVGLGMRKSKVWNFAELFISLFVKWQKPLKFLWEWNAVLCKPKSTMWTSFISPVKIILPSFSSVLDFFYLH